MSPTTELLRGAIPHPDVQSLEEVNRAILKPLGRPGLGWWALLARAIAGIGLGAVAYSFQLVLGIGVTGLTRTISRPSVGRSLKIPWAGRGTRRK